MVGRRSFVLKKELFPVFERTSGKQILICGGGELACSRVKTLMQFNFRICVVAPEICPELEELGRQGACSILRRVPLGADIIDHNNSYVVIATPDRERNTHLAQIARMCNTPVNIANDAEHSDFFFPAIAIGEQFTIGMVSPGNHPEEMEDAVRLLQTTLESYEEEEENLL